MPSLERIQPIAIIMVIIMPRGGSASASVELAYYVSYFLQTIDMETIVKTLKVESESFPHEGFIPVEYTCEGENIHPGLSIQHLPLGTRTLALIMDDPDAPNGVFTHWVAWNIPPTTDIRRDSNPGLSGVNSYGKTGYAGPCPPSGIHRYFLTIFALDTELDLSVGSSKEELRSAMSGHIIAQGEIMGRYQKERRASL